MGGYVLSDGEVLVTYITSGISLLLSVIGLVIAVRHFVLATGPPYTIRQTVKFVGKAIKSTWSFHGQPRGQLRSLLLVVVFLFFTIESVNALVACLGPDFPFVWIFPVYYPIRCCLLSQMGGLGQMIMVLRLEVIVFRSLRARNLIWHVSVLMYFVFTPAIIYVFMETNLALDSRGWPPEQGDALNYALNGAYPLVGLMCNLYGLHVAFWRSSDGTSTSTLGQPHPSSKGGERVTPSTSPGGTHAVLPLAAPQPLAVGALQTLGANLSTSSNPAIASNNVSVNRATGVSAPVASATTASRVKIQSALDRTFTCMTVIFILSWGIYFSLTTLGAKLWSPMIRFRTSTLAMIPCFLVEMSFKSLVHVQAKRIKTRSRVFLDTTHFESRTLGANTMPM